MKLCVLILLFVFVSTSSSQSINRIGIKGGVTYSSWSYDSPDRFELTYRRGIDLGIFTEWSNEWDFRFVNEVHYIQKGISSIIRNSQDIYRFSYLEYLSIPFLVKYRINSSSFSPALFVGPRIDYLLSFDSDLRESYRKYDIGVIIGLGIDLNSTFGLEARYNIGFSNVYSTPIENVQNRSLELLLFVAP